MDEQINNLRIEWSCRRGMLELDGIIMPFYKQHFSYLDNDQKQIFLRLLNCSDLQLYSWFFNQSKSEDKELQKMVNYIQELTSL